MLSFSNVSFKYENEQKLLIKDLNFNINKGEFVSIVGPSGCGKSTIFRLICGLERAGNGNILLDDRAVNDLKGHIGYMPQKDLLIPWRTIAQNVSLPLEVRGISTNEAIAEASKLLDSFGFSKYVEKYPKDLSGGMRQRVSFIRTLITGADILLLDEPFSALDAITKLSMQEWLQTQYCNLKKTIFFITHDVEEAIFLSSKIYAISEKPISKMKEIHISLSYPRNRYMLSSPDLLSIKEELINELKQRVLL
jgi:putative hydroxymethylpyrimidine transport system ATP-binding protein